ncbi:hypothetical protein HYW94_01760 [Candidatus Uhrbacteria bacterium]|nr:hypothetical protein [Candidatus Uhrbacteria bacterium]
MGNPIGNKMKSGMVSVSLSALGGALMSFNPLLIITVGTSFVFLLWVNFIGWNLLPMLRPLLVEPGNELVFFSSEFRGLLHIFALIFFTFIYLLEIMFFIAVIIFIINTIQGLLPPPLDSLFKF